MPASLYTPPPPCGLSLSLLLYTCARFTEWEFVDLSAPYWRLYWNADRGAAVRYSGGDTELGPSRLVLIPPNTAFAATLRGSVRHFFAHFTLEPAWGVPQLGVHVIDLAPQYRRLMQDLVARLNGHTHRAQLDLAVSELILRALQGVPESGWTRRDMDPRIRAAVSAIRLSTERKIDNAVLARSAAMSTNGFIRLFTRQMGISPARFSLRERLDKAAILLHHSDLSIDQIAQQCGFWDRNYFTKMFRTYRMQTPAAFRRQASS